MANNRNILISINASWNIYNFRAGLIEALKAEGYRIITAAPDDVYTPRLQAMVHQHIHLPMQNAGTSLLQELTLIFRYLCILQKARPAVILTYTIKPNIYASFAARLLGIPIINNISGLGTAFIRNNWLTHVAKLLYRFAFKSSACVFFQNPEDLDLFLEMKLVAPEKTALLPGSGIDLDYFRPVKEEPKKLGAPVSFVLIARMLWDKGIGEYVEAARIVKAAHPNTIFRLVGPKGVQNKTSIPDAVIDSWASEGVVEYLGETGAVRDVIAAHDCVVLPSYREGMSRVLLEAAAMGKPLIATNVPGCKHVVDDGENGFLCRVQDTADLAEVLKKFIALSPEERTRMGRESRAKAEQKFDQKIVHEAYLKKIAELIPK